MATASGEGGAEGARGGEPEGSGGVAGRKPEDRGSIRVTVPRDATKMVCVEFPGVVRDAARAVEALGGRARLDAQLRSRAALLHVRYRPGDPISHPVVGQAEPVRRVLLRLEARGGAEGGGGAGGSGGEAAPPAPADVTATVVGVCTKAYAFGTPADLQYVSAGVAGEADAGARVGAGGEADGGARAGAGDEAARGEGLEPELDRRPGAAVPPLRGIASLSVPLGDEGFPPEPLLAAPTLFLRQAGTVGLPALAARELRKRTLAAPGGGRPAKAPAGVGRGPGDSGAPDEAGGAPDEASGGGDAPDEAGGGDAFPDEAGALVEGGDAGGERGPASVATPAVAS